MTVISVANSAQLLSALSAAKAGDTISLAAGDYGTLKLDGALASQSFAKFAGEVTITSANAKNPATFTSIELDNVTNLTFDKVKFDLVANSAGDFTPFNVDESANITFRNAVFDGLLVNDLGSREGLMVTDSKNITVEGSEFYNFWYGAGFHGVENLKFSKNNLHDMAYDASRFSNITKGLIEDNRYSDMKNAQPAHRDMIQFWTEGDTTASSDVTIRGNVITSDAAPAMVQAIFLYNEAVTRHGAGTEMYYRNIVIEDNYILGNHPNGIVVGPAIGVSVKNNILVQDTNNAAARPGWHPEINVDASSKGVTITGNTANEITNTASGWTVSDNKIVTIGTIPPRPESTTPIPTDPVITPDPVTPPKAPSIGDDDLAGTTSNDIIRGLAGNDHLHGLAGHDKLFGQAGQDVLFGGDGNDQLTGGAGGDLLIGGLGADTFIFTNKTDSMPGAFDVLRGGDGGRAFDGAGAALGDIIDLSMIDANDGVAGNQAFVFRFAGTGGLTFTESNTSTIVQGNTDKDAAFEFTLVIEDGMTQHTQYTAADFVL